MIEAVLFDLDDTLFPQASWLSGAWRAAAQAAPEHIDPDALEAALVEVAAEGSDRGGIIDRALALVGHAEVEVAPLVRAFRGYRATRLDPYPGAFDAVADLRTRVPVGLVSDGDPDLQRGKLAALGLARAFDAVCWSDTLGRQHRKPDPAPFRAAAEALGVAPGRCVHIGDRPDKDVAGASAARLLGAVRVRTGEYRTQPDGPGCLTSVAGVVEAVAWVTAQLNAPSVVTTR